MDAERPGEVADLVGALLEQGDGDAGLGEVAGEEEAGGAAPTTITGRVEPAAGPPAVPVPVPFMVTSQSTTSVGQQALVNIRWQR